MQSFNNKKITRLILIFILALAVPSLTQAAAKLFRFKNEKGTTVTSHILPPEVVARGYEVITPAGDVIETVAPAMTPEQAAEKARLEQAKIDRAKRDKQLLLKYSALAEIRRAMERKLGEMNSKIKVMEANLTNIKIQIEAQQEQAANYERNGKDIPGVLLKSLDDLYTNMETTEAIIKARRDDYKVEKTKMEDDMERFKVLKGLK
jgi:hypothetical protein